MLRPDGGLSCHIKASVVILATKGDTKWPVLRAVVRDLYLTLASGVGTRARATLSGLWCTDLGLRMPVGAGAVSRGDF